MIMTYQTRIQFDEIKPLFEGRELTGSNSVPHAPLPLFGKRGALAPAVPPSTGLLNVFVTTFLFSLFGNIFFISDKYSL